MSDQTLKNTSLSFIPLESGLKADVETKTLFGVQVAMLGEAKGHGMELDETTLDQIVALGNSTSKGVKTRFGHPTECTPGLGTFLGTRDNFRRDGQYVRADLHLSEAASAQYADHVLQMAKLHPEKIGNSVVVSGERLFREDQDGNRLKDEDGKNLLPVLRVKHLHAVDVVDEPAAGNGMYAAPVEGVKFSPRTILEIRNAAEQPGFLERVKSFLSGREGVLPDEGETEEDADPEVSEELEVQMSALTLKDFKEKHPEVAKEHADELSASQTEALASARTEGAEAERGRILRFLSKCEPYAFEAEKDMPKGFALHAIEKNLSAEECLEGLLERKGKRSALATMESASDELGNLSASMPEGELTAAQAADQALVEFAMERAKKNGGS